MLGPLKRMKFLHHANNLHLISSVNCQKNNFIQLRTLMLTANCKLSEIVSSEEDTKKKRKKTIPLPKITLENIDGTTSIVLLEEAAKLAKHHNMFLIKMPYIDTKGSRLVYKIVDHATYINDTTTESQVHPSSNKINKHIKNCKTFTISSKICEHDLDTKLNNMNKLLKKNHKINIILNCSAQNKNKVDVVQYIKKKVDGIMTSEKEKGDVMIFNYSPPKNNDEQNNS